MCPFNVNIIRHDGKTIRLISIVIALAILILLGSCQSRNAPAARYGAAMVFDPVENQAILFGGRADGLIGLKYFDDMWSFRFETQTWTRIRSPRGPDGRLSPGMVYDPVRHQLIMFGGHIDRVRVGDTWLYDIADNLWEEVTPVNSPTPRSDMGLVYDKANNIVILFGGYCQEEDRESCDDTWSYDPLNNTWTELSPQPSPPIMYGHALVYDDTVKKSVLWGGHMSTVQNGQFASAGYGNSVWHFDYRQNSWQEVSKAGQPQARYWHQVALDTVDGKLLLFGGNGGQGFLNDSWILDSGGNSWKRTVTDLNPLPRINAAITYDSLNNVTILFGGLGEDRTDLKDTWVFKKTQSGDEWISINP